MAPNLFNRDTTLEIQFQQKKWRDVLKLGDGSPRVEIFLVHDLSNKGEDSQGRLDRYISEVCSLAANGAKVGCRLRSYRIDLEALQRGSFDEEYAGFVTSIHGILAKSASGSTGGLGSGVIFIAFELGVWVVQKFLYDQWPECDSDNPASLQNRLAGFFFLGTDKVFDNELEYTRERLTRVKAGSGDTPKPVPLRRFSRIQKNFHTLLESDEGAAVAGSTWFLPVPDLESPTPHLLIPGDKADGLKRSKSKLLSRLSPRNRNPSSAPDSDHDFAEKIPAFRKRIHAAVAARGYSDDLDTESDLYANHIKPATTVRKDSISSSLNEASLSGVSTPQSPQKVGSFDIMQEPYPMTTPTRQLKVPHRPAPLAAAASLQPVSTHPPPLLVHTPQAYAETHKVPSYFGRGSHDMVPDIIAPRSPGAHSRSQSGLSGVHNRSQSGEFHFFRSDSGQSGSLSPGTRSRRRQKSVSWKYPLDPANPIAMSVTQRIAEYYRSSTRSVDEASLYQKCRTSLTKYHLSPLECRIRAREALILFNKGKSNQAREALEKLMDEIQKVQKGASSSQSPENERQYLSHETPEYPEGPDLEALELVLLEVRYHWCLVAVRLGEYEAAYDELVCLEQRDWFQAINGILTKPSSEVEASALNDPLFEVVINTNRILALLWGRFGYFERADEMVAKADEQYARLRALEGTIPDLEPGEFPIDMRTTEMKIFLTRVKLGLFQGNDSDAQTLLVSLIPQLESHFGGAHFLTLEAASLHATILATLSDQKAESTCLAAYGATRQHLGEYHPLSMEILGTLADIYLSKSRPYEALDTVHHLRYKARENLKTSDHPQVLRYWLQVGEANLTIGNFVKARNELQSLVAAATKARNKPSRHDYEQHPELLRSLCPAAQRIQEDQTHHDLGQDPETLRDKMKLAMATACVGKMQEADKEAEECLRGQLAIFGPAVNNIVGAGLDHLVEALLDERDAADPFAPPPPPLHPNIVESLVTCSSILEKRDPGCKLADRILEQVLKVRESLPDSETHWLNLSIRLELAFNRLENGVKDDHEARQLVSLFENVTSSCEDALGTAHILTLRAKLGRLFTTVDVSAGPALFRREASQNLASQIDLMGHCHPMVLDSRWRLFVFEVLVFDDDDAHIASAQLLGALRLEEVRRERLIESLQLEEKIAGIYSMRLNDYERGLPILLDMMEYCFSTGETGFDDELEVLCREVANLTCEAIKSAAGRLQEQYNELDERGRGTLECMEKFLDLANEMLSQTDNTQSHVEGLALVGRQLQQIAYIESSDQAGRVSDKMEHAFLDWKKTWGLKDTATGLGIEGGNYTWKRREKKSRGKGKGERRAQARISGYVDDRDEENEGASEE